MLTYFLGGDLATQITAREHLVDCLNADLLRLRRYRAQDQSDSSHSDLDLDTAPAPESAPHWLNQQEARPSA